eukprot:8161321-Lingulodinium_polyedra.AAC.1
MNRTRGGNDSVQLSTLRRLRASHRPGPGAASRAGHRDGPGRRGHQRVLRVGACSVGVHFLLAPTDERQGPGELR